MGMDEVSEIAFSASIQFLIMRMIKARVLENAAPGSMRCQPVLAGAFLDEDGDAVGQWQGGFHDVEDFGDELGLLVGV